VRLVALVIVLATVYFAQLLFDATSLADLIPAWLLAWWPPLSALSLRLPNELVELAIWLTLLGLLGFGLLAPWWQGERGRAYRRLPRGRAFLRAWWWAAQLLLLLALLCAGAVAWLQTQPNLALLSLATWTGSLAIYTIGGLVANRVRPPVVYGDSYLETVRPWDGWIYWVVLLILFALIYSYRLFDVPLRIDPFSARVGLAAQGWVRDLELPRLAAAPNELPLPTLSFMAMTRLVIRDNLASIRIAGLISALFLISAVWLVGSELFRRVPIYGHYGEVLEDDGRWIALMSMIIVGVSVPLYHWSRTPFVLESTGLATFSLWALLRGLRRDRPGLLGLSALMLAWAVYYGPVGMTFLIIALLVWGGVLLLESSWLTGKYIARERGDSVPVQRGVGWRGFGYWLAGITIGIAPLLSRWLTVPGSLASQWIWPDGVLVREGSALVAWRARLEMAALGLNQLGDATGTLIYGDPFVHSLLAPLLALALGALLLNIDTLMGWTLTLWLLVATLVAGLSVPVVPSWAAMIMLLPAIGMSVAFVLDRLRLHIMTNAGTWTLQATVYLAVGTVIAAGFFGWINFYHVAQGDGDLASAVVRALRDAGDRPVVLVSSNIALEQVTGERVVQLLAQDRSDLAQLPTVDARTWPPMQPGTRLLLAPGDSTLQQAMRAAYPNGMLTVVRDVDANPLLYIYDIIDTATYRE
jgi:hypothetical protein